MSIITRAPKCWNGCNRRRRLPIVPIWTAPRVSIWMARRSLPSLRVFTRAGAGFIFHRRELGSFVEVPSFRSFFRGGAAVLLDQLKRGRFVFLAHQNDGAADGQHILSIVHASDLRVDTNRFKQSFDYQGLGILLGIEYSNQLFIGL